MRGPNLSTDMRRILYTASLMVTICLLPVRLLAQADPNAPDASKIKVRFGPLMLNPVVTFRDIGIDENVFNDPTSPKRDFSMTISPRTELFLRLGPSWLNGSLSEDIVWFREYTAERQVNNTRGVGWKLPAGRFTTNVQTSRTHTRERYGYEIDERAARSVISYTASASYRVLYNTAVDFTVYRNSVEYDEGVQFKGVKLSDELDVVTDALTLGIKQYLTPLTALSATFNRTRDRYRVQSIRDAQTTEGRIAMSFDPKAILKGNAAIGFADFKPDNSTIPPYTGLTAAADVSTTVRGVTNITFRADRQVQNSYDIKQPYYIQSGFFLEVAQQILGRVDLVGRVGLEYLSYRDRSGEIVEVVERVDRVQTYGAGIGYHMGRSLRIGINYDRTRRRSPIESREYERPRVGTAITYDF